MGGLPGLRRGPSGGGEGAAVGGTVVRPAGGVEIVGQAATLIEMPVSLQINGQMKSFAVEPVTVQSVVDELGLKGDRIAVERNGAIVRREEWSATQVVAGDRLEIVHFVGGGVSPGRHMPSVQSGWPLSKK